MILEPPVCGLAGLALFSVAPLVLRAHVKNGQPAGPLKLRQECKRRESAVGPAALGFQGTFTDNTALAAVPGGAGHVLQTLADPTDLF